MAKSKQVEQVLQIKHISPDIMRKFKIYAVSNNMTQAEAFTEAVLAITSDKN